MWCHRPPSTCDLESTPAALPCLLSLCLCYLSRLMGFINFWGRVPSEPAPDDDDDDDAAVRLFSLDFDTLPGEKNSEEYRSALKAFVDRLGEQCMELTPATDGDLPWTTAGEKDNISYAHLRVAGSQFPISRHTAEFSAPASTVLGMFSSFNYTSLIDPYAFHVEVKEECELGPEYNWGHVAWTADSINPLFAVRDFVTLDFASRSRSLIVSRSVQHGLVPRTEHPTQFSFLFKSLKSRTYRVPLLYALRVLPIDENRCVVHQIQWSDVGGVLPDSIVVGSVEKFGYDSMARMRKVVEKAVAKKIVAPMEDPLLPAWTPDPAAKIPELFS